MADYTGHGKPDLIFIKTANTGSKQVEVHIASASSNYAERVLETGTTFAQESNGTWLVADYTGDGKPDLIYIKTKDTGTGTVEVHVASEASGYQQRVLETGTTFGLEYDGVWTMADTTGDGKLDLIFIKIANTPSGRVEVHIASGASNYQSRILETATTFVNETDGTWLLVPWAQKRQPGGPTLPQDLVFIKTANTGTNTVEVHVASAASKFQTRVFEQGTTFAPETDGTWLMINYTGRANPDLAFIKTANTGTGKVEVHIAAAA
ncbi:hypothetical protein MMC18_009698 [Xylographa bjoerkii]|nr:hypothetical protein [Xylographa bjoerkii]